MSKSMRVFMDGTEYAAQPGQMILDLAQANGVFIPSLCAFEGIGPAGACRLCVVEIKGNPRLLPACVTQVADGMEVTTNSPRVAKYRRMMIELLLAERNHVCAVCVSNGHCELQTLAQQLGVTHTRYPYRCPAHPVDASHARFRYDANRCILCTRCVRACAEVEGAHTWNIMGRGIHSEPITDLRRPWGEAKTCTGCGKCVHACPTGALAEKGKAASEMEKRKDILPYLAAMRAGAR